MTDVVSLAAELLALDSSTGAESSAVDFVSKWLVARGWNVTLQEVTRERANVWASRKGRGVTLSTHLDTGGWIAWGAVPTDGPLGTTEERLWRSLAELWCELVQAGCDPVALRTQALVTPQCGLALHGESQAARVLELSARLADRVHDQAAATRFSLGA